VSDFDTLLYSSHDGLATITLDRPDKRNALHLEAFAELTRAAEAASADPAVHGILVRANGPSFCAGIDLTALAGLSGAAEDRFEEFVRIAQGPYRSLALAAKPVVAAVRGHALGAGFQLALACDVRVVAADASFGLLEARYGLIPDLGGLWHLAREVGPARAKELAWSARTIDAAEADRLGLIARIVAPEDVDAEAEAIARSLIAHSPVTTRTVKDLVDRAGGLSLDQELDAEAAAQAQVLRSEDHAEAVAAFLERRTPRYTGR
jgi:enoyl-CoA hydratase/carnithine racemase